MEEEKENVEKETEYDLKKELANKQLELDEMQERLKRIMAEFDNYKKRETKEKQNLYNFLLADIVKSLLPVVDNLEKAVNAETEDKTYKEGIELVYKKFMEIISNMGVERIETIRKTFDPELHEAVSSVTDEKLGEKEIKEEYQAGYKIGSKVIRHAMGCSG